MARGLDNLCPGRIVEKGSEGITFVLARSFFFLVSLFWGEWGREGKGDDLSLMSRRS